MATQTAQSNVSIEAAEQSSQDWQKLTGFFSGMVELMEVYFGAPAIISRLDPEYRMGLTAKEKAEIDVDLLG